jgi:hypothetical protein
MILRKARALVKVDVSVLVGARSPHAMSNAKQKRVSEAPRFHVPTPQIMAVVVRDGGNLVGLPGDPRARVDRYGVWSGPDKLILMDGSLLSVAYLLRRGVRPIDIELLEDAERARLTQAIAYALEDLGRMT